MDEYVSGAMTYLQANPLVAAAVGLVLLYLLIRKTRVFLYLLVLVAVLGAVSFIISELAVKGGASKRKIIDQTSTQDLK